MSRDGAPTSQWQAHDTFEGSPDPERARGKLLVRRPGLPEVEVEVRPGLVIGRSPALADLVLDDELVSRKHAELHVDPRGYFRLQDLGSRNGIRFADRMVRRLNLVDGDVFAIGKTELVFTAAKPRLVRVAVEPPPRVDTIMVDSKIAVPEPLPEPEPGDGLDAIQQLGWNTRSGSLEPPRPSQVRAPVAGFGEAPNRNPTPAPAGEEEPEG